VPRTDEARCPFQGQRAFARGGCVL